MRVAPLASMAALTALDAVGGKIVDDHDIAGIERGREHLLDIGEKTFAIHRPIQNEGRRHAGKTQACGEGRRLPMAVRHGRPASLSARAAAVATGHLGVHAGLVDEDEPFGFQLRLVLEPGTAPP